MYGKWEPETLMPFLKYHFSQNVDVQKSNFGLVWLLLSSPFKCICNMKSVCLTTKPNMAD